MFAERVIGKDGICFNGRRFYNALLQCRAGEKATVRLHPADKDTLLATLSDGDCWQVRAIKAGYSKRHTKKTSVS